MSKRVIYIIHVTFMLMTTSNDFDLLDPTARKPKIDPIKLFDRFIQMGYISHMNRFYKYDESERKYQEIPKLELENHIYKIAFNLGAYMDESHIKNMLRMYQGINQPKDMLIRSMEEKRSKKIPIPEDELTILFNSKLSLPFKNCIYSIDYDLSCNPTPDFFSTYHFNANLYLNGYPEDYNYESLETAKWALDKILPTEELKTLFFEMVGYSLYGEEMNPPAIFVILGGGGTGKSALHNMLMHFAEPIISQLAIEQVSTEFLTHKLQGIKLNIAGETGEGKNTAYSKVDGELLKRLSDGQKITVNVKNKEPIDFYNTAKLWFISNTLPNFQDTSSGMLRRIVVLPCKVRQKKEDELWDKLKTPEAMDYLAIESLKAYKSFLERGKSFTSSVDVEQEITNFALQDGLKDYLVWRYNTYDPTLISMELHEYRLQDIYIDYKNFIYDSGGKPMGKRTLLSRLTTEFNMHTETVRDQQENGRPTNVTILIRRTY